MAKTWVNPQEGTVGQVQFLQYGQNKYEVVDAQSRTNIDDLDSRLVTVEALINADENDVIDKVQEIITWFKDVSDQETGVTLLTNVVTLQNDVASLQNDVTTINVTLTTINATISDLSEAVSTLESNSAHTGTDTAAGITIELTTGNPELTVSAAVVTYTAAQGDDPANLSASNTEAVMLGSAIEQIKSYVDAVADSKAVEAASSALADLDATVDDDDAGIAVSVTQTDGLITNVTVNVTASNVTYTAAEDATPADLVASDTASVLVGSAIEQIKSYVDAKATAALSGIDVIGDSNNYVSVTETEVSGVKTYELGLNMKYQSNTLIFGGSQVVTTTTPEPVNNDDSDTPAETGE